MKHWIFSVILIISLACTQIYAAADSWAAVPVREEVQEGQEWEAREQQVQTLGAQVREVRVQGDGLKEAAAVKGTAGAAGAGETAGEGDFLKLYAQSAVLMDGDTGRILYGKGRDIIRPMASTTKIMTCILALEAGKGEETVKASSNAASQPKVHLGVREGEEYRLEDLLYALMLESYNDAAVMIAEHIGGSVEGFASMMNEKAAGLECRDTYFITPNGLDGVKTDEQGRAMLSGGPEALFRHGLGEYGR